MNLYTHCQNLSVLTLRNVACLAFICSSMCFIVSERAEICVFISSSVCFIIWIFCSSSSHSAVISASFSSMRNWWSFLNSSFIRRSVCWAWVSTTNRNNIEFSSVLCWVCWRDSIWQCVFTWMCWTASSHSPCTSSVCLSCSCKDFSLILSSS